MRMEKVNLRHDLRWRGWVVGLLIAVLRVQAQICGNLTSYQIQSGTVHDVNHDGFPDFRLQVEQGRLVEYRGPQLGCVVIDSYWVRVVPLGGNELLSKPNGPMRSAVPLTAGTELSGVTPSDWGTAAGVVYFKGDPSMVSPLENGAAGPLNLPTGGSAFFGLRLVGHDGPRHAWIRLAAGPDVSVVDMAAQQLPSENLAAGIHPPVPGALEATSRPLDTDGDGLIDLFVVRRQTTEVVGNGGETQVTTRVTLLDPQEGQVLTGPGRPGWPVGDAAVGLGDGALVRATLEAPREWKATGLVGPVWMGTSSNGVEISSVGPVAVPGGASVALRRVGGVLAILDFNDRGEVLGVDFTKEGVIAAGMSKRIPGDASLVAREYLDLNRDGTADLVAITTSTSDQTPGAQATTEATVLHTFGRNRLGTVFRANEVVFPSIALESGGSLRKTIDLRTRILRFSQIPPSEVVTSVPKDQYLPVYLAMADGYQTGWLSVDASLLPLKWRAGLAPGVG